MDFSILLSRQCFIIASTITLVGCQGMAPPPNTTLPTQTSITVYSAGDIADCNSNLPVNSGAAQTAALIRDGLANDPSARVITLGDHTYRLGRAVEFTSCYDPTWGQFKSKTYPSPGNHEYSIPGAFGYFNYFGLAAGPDRRGYYSVELGKWHVISLNSNLDGAEASAQLQWLRDDLRHQKSTCTLAFWHHPMYSSGRRQGERRMADAWKILQDAGADLVLSGHDHHYERFAPLNAAGQRDDLRGIRQFVVGTGGADRYTPGKPQLGSEALQHTARGVLKLVLRDTSYEWTFLPVAGEDYTDSGTAQCH